MSDEALNATVISRNDLTEELSIVRIAPDSGQVPAFEPGQYCTLGLPREDASTPLAGTVAGASAGASAISGAGVPIIEGARPRVRLTRRAYSIASSALVRDHLELYLVLVAEGKLTPRIWTIPQGGRVWLDGRVGGRFTLRDVPADKDLVMVSTGTGLAPFVSMLRTYRHASPRRWRRYVVIHGARMACDLGYCDELMQAARDDPSVIYVPIVTREPSGSAWSGLRGRVQAVLEPDNYRRLVGAPLEPAESEVFLCGNPAMIDEVRALLRARGFATQTADAPGNIHFERYW